MKRKIYLILVILVSLSIPFYAIFLWQPGNEVDILKSIFVNSKEVLSNNVIQEGNTNSDKVENARVSEMVQENNNIEEIKRKMKKEDLTRVKAIFNKISTVDQNKVFQFIEESKYDYTKANKILELMKKRLSIEDYEEFKGILKGYITIE